MEKALATLAIKVAPNEEARLVSINNIQFYINTNTAKEYDLGDAVIVYDGKGGEKNLPMNRFVELKDGVDIINGTFLILKKDYAVTSGKYISIDDETAKKYLKMFQHPEIFLFINDKLHVFKVRFGTEYILTRTVDLWSEEDKVPDDVVVSKEEDMNGK